MCDLFCLFFPDFVFCFISAGERNIVQILKTKWWKYLVMGVADVEANYVVVRAYQFTTLTSIQVRINELITA